MVLSTMRAVHSVHLMNEEQRLAPAADPQTKARFPALF